MTRKARTHSLKRREASAESAADALSSLFLHGAEATAANDELRLESNLPAAVMVMPQEIAIIRAFIAMEIEALLARGDSSGGETPK